MKTLAGLGVDETGGTDGRAPLVLLHGLTFDRTMWKPVLAEVTSLDPNRRALAFDLPGHGESAAWPAYDLASVAAGIHRAVEEAGLQRPVIVGHSLAGIVATVYAAVFPTSGVVNVDQPLQTAPFAEFVQSIAEQLRSPAFPALWQRFAASMHIELLPPEAQDLLRASSDPRQDLVLAYWAEVLDGPVSELAERTDSTLRALRVADVPYLVVTGEEPPAEYRAWLQQALPQVNVTVLPGSGHFPHLAHPAKFAHVLAGTARWASG